MNNEKQSSPSARIDALTEGVFQTPFAVAQPSEIAGNGEDDDRMEEDDNQYGQSPHASETSEAFGEVWTVKYRDWLNAYDLTDQQWKAIESHIELGVNAAESFANFAIAKFEADAKVNEQNKVIDALRLLLFRETGWQESRLNANINDMMQSMKDAAVTTASADGHSSVGAPQATRFGPYLNVTADRSLYIVNATADSMHQLREHLLTCFRNGQVDNRDKMMSQTAIKQLHRAMLTFNEHVGRSLTVDEWLAWPAERLARAIEVAFPRSGAVSSLDWIHDFDKLFVELDVLSEDSYRPYLNKITEIEELAVSARKISTVKQVLTRLRTHLLTVPKGLSGKVTQCNKAMDQEIQKFADEGKLNTLEDYIVAFGTTCKREARNVQRAQAVDEQL